MKNKENYFLTVHDELFFDLMVNYRSPYRRPARTEVYFVNDTPLFTVHELILLAILIDFKIKNPSTDSAISLSYIHNKYRGKRTGKNEVMSISDLNAYMKALNGLQEKRVYLNTNFTRMRSEQFKIINNARIFKIINIRGESNGDLVFEYSLCDYGEIILKCKRYSDLLPIKLLETSYKQNMKIYIAMYLARLIFINGKPRRNIKKFVVAKESIMENVRIHNEDGIDIGKNLFELMNEKDHSKYAKIKLFDKYVIEVLEMLKHEASILDYKVMSGSNYKYQIDLKY